MAVPADLRERFGFLIRACRLEHEMTQEDLADAVGVHQPSVSAWELGRALPDFETMSVLANLFGIDLNTLNDPPELSATAIKAAIR